MKPLIKKCARSLRPVVKWAASCADMVRQPPPGIIVLIYHRIGRSSPIEVDMPLATFKRQMEVLAASARVVPLDVAVDALVDQTPLSIVDPIVITFDDGTADFERYALPVLERHRLPVTLYLTTDFIESGRSFPHQGHPLSWSGVCDALSTGLVTAGSHTHTHPRLDKVWASEAADELERSIGLIEDRLDLRPEHFAYPYGIPGGPLVENEVKKRTRTAAIGGTRANLSARTDLHRLSRSPIQFSDGMKYFEKKAAGGMWLEDSMRQFANGVHSQLKRQRS
jgi:hypothetical protein